MPGINSHTISLVATLITMWFVLWVFWGGVGFRIGVFVFVVVILMLEGVAFRALGMLGKCSTIQVYTQPFILSF